MTLLKLSLQYRRVKTLSPFHSVDLILLTFLIYGMIEERVGGVVVPGKVEWKSFASLGFYLHDCAHGVGHVG